MRTRIQSAYEQWSAATQPRDASDVQRQEIRRAFFSGAFTTLGVLVDATAGDDVSEDQGVVILEAMHRECEHFFKVLVATGKA